MWSITLHPYLNKSWPRQRSLSKKISILTSLSSWICRKNRVHVLQVHNNVFSYMLVNMIKFAMELFKVIPKVSIIRGRLGEISTTSSPTIFSTPFSIEHDSLRFHILLKISLIQIKNIFASVYGKNSWTYFSKHPWLER